MDPKPQINSELRDALHWVNIITNISSQKRPRSLCLCPYIIVFRKFPICRVKVFPKSWFFPFNLLNDRFHPDVEKIIIPFTIMSRLFIQAYGINLIKRLSHTLQSTIFWISTQPNCSSSTTEEAYDRQMTLPLNVNWPRTTRS